MLANLREKLKGWKTTIWSAALVVAGLLATLLSMLTGDQIAIFIPDKYHVFIPLIISVIGLVTGALRYVTTGPVGSKGEAEPPANIKAGD